MTHATPQDISQLKPEIVVEVSFHEWTPRGELREARFLGLRHDKLAPRGDCQPAIDPRLSWTKARVETVGRVMTAGSDL
ncbi:hypothetical protein GCT13_36920 [Paraburkholderia sp. CNPSo 3157]|uniref:DNA ligase (ATP) n=1 Tax=Paraburkholderia franconis TaxID=2654983 RepID=A0A7X1NHX9_9BURK|nr:hypothetical protein [Paraburkholderia franconis]MPW22264.1 hypothetical protein [Paraburkholderia franconis]